jgi:hypothetical protein
MPRLSDQRHYMDLESTGKAVSPFQRRTTDALQQSQMYLLMLNTAFWEDVSSGSFSYSPFLSGNLFLFLFSLYTNLSLL